MDIPQYWRSFSVREHSSLKRHFFEVAICRWFSMLCVSDLRLTFHQNLKSISTWLLFIPEDYFLTTHCKFRSSIATFLIENTSDYCVYLGHFLPNAVQFFEDVLNFSHGFSAVNTCTIAIVTTSTKIYFSTKFYWYNFIRTFLPILVRSINLLRNISLRNWFQRDSNGFFFSAMWIHLPMPCDKELMDIYVSSKFLTDFFQIEL